MQINPVEDIENAYNSKDFFVGFVLAEVYFEYEVNRILDNLIEGRLPLEMLKEWRLRTKVECLCQLGLLNPLTRNKIEKIMSVRNNLVHPLDVTDKEERRHDIFLRYKLNEKEKSFLLSFKECYSELIQADSRTFKARAFTEIRKY